jgi:hypothetical protein
MHIHMYFRGIFFLKTEQNKILLKHIHAWMHAYTHGHMFINNNYKHPTKKDKTRTHLISFRM